MDTQHWECDIFRGGKEVGEGNGIGYTAVCSGSNVASSTKPKTGLALHPNSQKPNVKKVVSGKSRLVHRLTTSDSPGHHMPTEEKIETTGAHMISCRGRCIEYTDQTRVSVLDGQSIPSLKHINRCWPFGGPYPSLDLNTGPAYIADKSYILADLQALDLDPSRENAVPAEGHVYYRSPNPEPAGNNSNFPLPSQNPAQTSQIPANSSNRSSAVSTNQEGGDGLPSTCGSIIHTTGSGWGVREDYRQFLFWPCLCFSSATS